MIKQKIILLVLALVFMLPAFCQPANAIIDSERKYKEAKQLFMQEQYALTYPILKELMAQYPENTTSDHTYLNDDIHYYYIVCGLKLQHLIAEQEAKQYIELINNEPRRQLLSYHLAKFYFLKNNFNKAIDYYEKIRLDNLTNDEIADAKFEKAYSYFNLKNFAKAKTLFDEIHQLPNNKYYIPANYYYGFISYYDKQYEEALQAFKLVETFDEYKRIVPYYVAEIYYFQGKKDEALQYGENILSKENDLYYEKELKLLIGQVYFEKKNYQKALPLIESYINSSNKVSKEVMYELSYCYYETNQLEKAIEGFKMLSIEKDAMGQNSMYLLGDCYLRTNQKANARNAFQYCAYNSSNKLQQQVSRFNYAKLSYELGFEDIALSEIKKYLNDYPDSEYDTQAKEILVALLANTNNFADALRVYESLNKPATSIQKIYPRILYGRAVELINDQQINKAGELLTKLLQLPSSTITPYANFWKGEIAYRNSNYDEATRYLNSFLQSNVAPQGEANTTTAKYDLGYCWLKKEDYKQALVFFEQITTKISASSSTIEQDAYIRSADCYYMMKDFGKANNMYENVIKNALPQSDYALFQKAMISGVKNSTEKIKVLNNLIKQYSQSNLVVDAHIEIANTYIADEKFSEAITSLSSLLNLPGAQGIKPKIYLNLGLSYYNLNKNKEALDNYTWLIQNYPQSSEADEATVIMKNIYIEEGKPDDYVKLMRKYGKNISVSEADSLTYAAAELKYNAGDCSAAITGFTRYITQNPQGAYLLEANYWRSECYRKNKDWQNALEGYAYVSNKGLSNYFEKATLEAAHINYFELKDYSEAKKYFELLYTNAVNPDNQQEALRGLIRCYYQLKDYAQANDAAEKLLAQKGVSTDDKSIAFLVLGKSQQINNDCTAAIASFKSCASLNKASWGAEARYEIAHCYFTMDNLTAAEKAAMTVIKETGSYDYWVTKSYILLGDIFMKQKDYFNAKATYESVAKNAAIPELKDEAQEKLNKAVEEEKENSKINTP